MAFSWYVENNDGDSKLFSGEKLKELAASGRLLRTDLVRREDQAKPVLAGKIKGLFAEEETTNRKATSPPPLPTKAPGVASSVGSSSSDKPPEARPDTSPLSRIGFHIKGLGETTKAAAGLATAQGRKAHLTKMAIPAAFLELGRANFAVGRFRDEFADLYSRITATQQERERLRRAQIDRQTPPTISEKALDVASRLKVTAQAKLIALKEESFLRQLGESCYERHGERSGPENLVRPISECRSKLEALDRGIEQLSGVGKGRFITPRKLLIGAIACCVVVIGLMAFKSATKGGSNRIEQVTGPLVQVDEPGQSPRLNPARNRKTNHLGDDLDQSSQEGGSVKSAGKKAASATTGHLIGNPLQVRIIEKPIAAFRAKYRVEKMRFSSNGDLLLVNDKEIWHLASRRKLLFKQEKPDYMPLTADLSFDGKLLASSAFEFDEKSRESYAALRIWDIRSDGLDGLKRIKIQTKLGYGSDKWQTVRWSPRSNYLAACSNEVLIIIRDPLRGATEKMIVHPSLLTGEVNGLGRLLGTGFKHNVTGVAFSPDEKLLAVAFQNFGVHVFTLPDCQSQAVLSFDEPIERWEWNPEHPGWATQPVRFSDDGTLLATFQKHQQRRGEEAGGSGSTYSVKFWDTLSWKDLSTIPKKGMGDSNRELHAVGFLPGRSVYAAASVDKSLLMTIWDARTAEAMASIRPFLLPNMGSAISISANGNAVLFNQGAGGLQVWDVAGSGPIARIDDKRLHDPRNASISPDANLVATGYPDGEVNLWDLSISGRTVTIEEMLIESEGATREHERQNSFLHRKAQPVTKRLFDQIKVGMTPIEVHKLLGGQPTTEETEVDRVSDHRGGRLRGVALITRFTEYYRGQGRDDAKVVLIFEGQGSGPPLVKKYQVGLD